MVTDNLPNMDADEVIAFKECAKRSGKTIYAYADENGNLKSTIHVEMVENAQFYIFSPSGYRYATRAS